MAPPAAPAPKGPATLGALLKVAGLVTSTPAPAAPAAPVKAAAAAPAATKAAAAGTGTIPPSMPAHEPARTPRTSATQPEKQDTGATGGAAAAAATKKVSSFNEMGLMIENGKIIGCDGSIYKTAAQRKLASIGVICLNAAEAESVMQAKIAQAEQVKAAQLEKLAQEERFKGALQYDGMALRGAALRLANDQITIEDVTKLANQLGVPVEEIIKSAEALKRDGERASAPGPALVGGNLGSAARPSSSRVLEAAGETRETVGFEPEAVAGTRQPTTGTDEKLIRFTDVYTLPGNPGLDKGQVVDQGKGL